ncbi:MAG: hypothetical protein ACLPVW_11140 [Terriglobales bacterium]
MAVFGVIWAAFWFTHNGLYFYFDPQDCVHANPESRVFPLSASSATFLPFLDHYIGVTKLMVTVAAASIAFGGDKGQRPVLLIVIAKLLLAWSILYGVFFCTVLLWRYDEYAQNMQSYTRGWYSTVFASGFASFVCFIAGYVAWGWGLSR